jgi:hypothetical protein
MKILSNLIAPFLILVLFSSCQREIDGSLPRGVAAQYEYLTRYTVLDTAWVPGKDTMIDNRFYYDNKKRISRGFSTYHQANASFQSSPLYTHDFVYTYESDTAVFPSKVTDTYKSLVNPADTWTETAFLWYKDGLVSKDSILTKNGGRKVTTYEKLSNIFFRVIHSKPAIDTSYSRVEWKFQNLQFEADSLFFFISGVRFYRTFTKYLLYDAGFNPFNKIMLPYRAPFNQRGLQFYNLFYDLSYPGLNNPLLLTENGSLRWSWNYVLNNDGLPVIARMTDKKKAFFRYTRIL